jgi:hypothetical protein
MILEDENTACFGNDLERLLRFLKFADYIVKLKRDKYFYKHQIMANKEGYYLTIQVYSKKTMEPCYLV